LALYVGFAASRVGGNAHKAANARFNDHGKFLSIGGRDCLYI
jgi:hypothetical protein